MTPAVSAMLTLLRDPEELLRHVTDAMIAEQLDPFSREEWLQKCERWAKKNPDFPCGSTGVRALRR